MLETTFVRRPQKSPKVGNTVIFRSLNQLHRPPDLREGEVETRLYHIDSFISVLKHRPSPEYFPYITGVRFTHLCLTLNIPQNSPPYLTS